MLNPLTLISKIFKSSNQKELDKLAKNFLIKLINLRFSFSKLDDSEFSKKTLVLKEVLKNGKSIDEILPEAYALVREASKRVNNERHFDVQLIGGIVLNQNKIARNENW